MSHSFSLFYAFTDAFRNLRGNLATMLLSSFTVAFSLAIFVFFFTVSVNLNRAIEKWGDRTRIAVYLKEGLGEGIGEGVEVMEGLKRAMEAIPGVKSAEYVSKESALRRLRAEFKGHEGILEGVDAEVLPSSFEILLDISRINPDSVRTIVTDLKGMEEVEEVIWGAEWVEKFSASLKFIEVFTYVIGAFLAAAAIFIISNTIRLTVYARRSEIEVMRYLGGTGLFIKTPFFIEGVAAGVAGGLLSLGILSACRYVLGLYVPHSFAFVIENPFPLTALCGMLVSSGFFLGGVGSLVSMGRFLKV